MKLFWVTTEDHDEDWFVVASNPEEVSRFHEDAEGYDPGDATAEEILSIPENIPADPGWPSDEFLVAVGAKFITENPPRVVEINGRKFSEGLLESFLNEIEDNAFEKRGLERLNKTPKPSMH